MDEGKEVAEECKRLREVLDSKQEWWVRGMALTSLAKLEGQAGITRLVGALSDPDLRMDALKGLSSLAAGSNDPIVLNILAQEIRRENPKNISLLVKTFLAVGGNAKTLTQEVVDRLEPDVAATVRWLCNDIGPREAAAKLRPACGGAAASEKTLEKIDAKWQKDLDAVGVVWELLGGWNRIAAPFYKTVVSPVDHTETVYKLAAITEEHFALDEVVQVTEPDGNFRLTLVHQGAGYSFPVENHGRWCNVVAVIDGLNSILDRLGLPERFIELSSGTSDVAIVTFARADIFMSVAREFGIPLGRSD
jgi:hypothetical protein